MHCTLISIPSFTIYFFIIGSARHVQGRVGLVSGTPDTQGRRASRGSEVGER